MTRPQPLWSSLYLPTAEQEDVAAALVGIHTRVGYQPFNPFPGGSGSPIRAIQFSRLFVAPPQEGWTRLIGQPDSDLLPELASQLGIGLIYVWVAHEEGGVEAIGGSLSHFLREGKTEEDLQQALTAPLPAASKPDFVSNLAGEYGIDPKQAGELVQKTIGSLFGKLNKDGSAEAQTQAAELVSRSRFSWKMPAAQRVAAITDCLRLPANWREPSYHDLTAAYQAACWLELNGNLLPGDEAALDKVAYPLDYLLAYFAR